MIFQQEGIAMFNVLIVSTAACIAPTPVAQVDYSVALGTFNSLIDQNSESNMNYGSWVECEKIIPSFKTKSLNKIEIKPLNLKEESIIFDEDYEDLFINTDFKKVGLDIVEEANLKSLDEDILFFDEGPIEIIENEEPIIRGTYTIPKDSRYLS